MADTPFELTPQSVSDLVDALSVAAEDLSARLPDGELGYMYADDYTDEDLEEMEAKVARWNVLYGQLILVLNDHYQKS